MMYPSVAELSAVVDTSPWAAAVTGSQKVGITNLPAHCAHSSSTSSASPALEPLFHVMITSSKLPNKIEKDLSHIDFRPEI
jgi:hypothetical protein